jgi:hypothetical protein
MVRINWDYFRGVYSECRFWENRVLEHKMNRLVSKELQAKKEVVKWIV